jgi:hypothetical protein
VTEDERCIWTWVAQRALQTLPAVVLTFMDHRHPVPSAYAHAMVLLYITADM